MVEENEIAQPKELTREQLSQEILQDYQLAVESREASLIGRKEVLTGKAKFGIFGDGKEIAQIAMAKQTNPGDWRSGYYRDQTYMMATGELTLPQFFAQLYAHPDLNYDPHSGGRQMNAHFATRFIDDHGDWKNQMLTKNTSADMSPTAGQMPRLLGLAYASKFYRNSEELQSKYGNFTHEGNEVAFGTIGDASTSEGLFWETINAAGVLQVPMVLAVWDDGYGISVPKKYQTTKESISKVLAGFQRTEELKGWEIIPVKGWDYAQLCLSFERAANLARNEHVPVLVHVTQLTQPQGHSTSGSHERYKNEERLSWEKEYDGIHQMRKWILNNEIANEGEISKLEQEAKDNVKQAKKEAWSNYQNAIKTELQELDHILSELATNSMYVDDLENLREDLKKSLELSYGLLDTTAKKASYIIREEEIDTSELYQWMKNKNEANMDRFNSHLYSQTPYSPMLVEHTEPEYDTEEMVDGREVLQQNFDTILSKYPNTLIFGEDAGYIGGVNQTLAGLQEKYGRNRVFDTGIREATIIGQGIGLALRGFRPIAEIQYLDYLLYAIQTLSDDLASLRYRTKGGQAAPLIISTRGHRLEGIWHSGSPMGMIINSLRGIHVCVPRNMTQAAGFYNTLLKGDDPGLIIEPLNGYRIKEPKPSNPGEYTTPLGIPEVIIEGTDITLVTYGSLVRIAQEAINDLEEMDISVELIDVQTLLPFDVEQMISKSIEKTNKVLFLDEDVPGGATAYMMQQVLEKQQAFIFLDSEPKTLSAKPHRPAYGSDGDHFSKPNKQDIIDSIYQIMHEYNPQSYPAV